MKAPLLRFKRHRTLAKSKVEKHWFWDEYTEDQQLEYIENHPNSKFAKEFKARNKKEQEQKEKKKAPARKPPVNPNRTEQDAKLTAQVKEKYGIAIPPAWSNVVFHSAQGNERGIIAQGRDIKGRSQRLENPEYRENKIREKHYKIRTTLTPKVPAITKSLRKEILKGNEEAKVLYLILKSGFRIGSSKSTGAERAYGASTLLGKHASVEGNKVTFNFKGKGGVEQNHTINDPVIAEFIKGKNPEDPIFNTNEEKIRALWKSYGQDRVHDIRSFVATDTAQKALDKFGPIENEKEYRQMLKHVSEQTAKKLGNKPAESLKTYIDHSIFSELEERLKETANNKQKFIVTQFDEDAKEYVEVVPKRQAHRIWEKEIDRLVKKYYRPKNKGV